MYFRLLKCISLNLGKPLNFFTELHSRILSGKNASALRSLYYPAIQGFPPEGLVRYVRRMTKFGIVGQLSCLAGVDSVFN